VTAPSDASRRLEGELSQGVPIRLIHDAHLAGRSGRLTFASDAERCALHFVDGEVVAVWSSRPEHGLAALLAGGGVLRATALEEAEKEAAVTGHPLGLTPLPELDPDPPRGKRPHVVGEGFVE
jgi:hypothetical protein